MRSYESKQVEKPPSALRPPQGSRPDAHALLGLQRSIGNAGVVQLLASEQEDASPVRSVVGKRGGRALDAGLRQDMETRFGQDFSGVRVHTGTLAASSAAAVGARAYTVGNEIVLGAGSPNLGTPTGQRMLAHELTHVVQQRSGPVDGRPAPGGIRLSDPSDRFERQAEEVADQVMTQRLTGGLDAAGPELQRIAEEREDEDEE